MAVAYSSFMGFKQLIQVYHKITTVYTCSHYLIFYMSGTRWGCDGMASWTMGRGLMAGSEQARKHTLSTSPELYVGGDSRNMDYFHRHEAAVAPQHFRV
jgi:hypothetical protein